MKRLVNTVRNFVFKVDGQDLTEYALLVALIALAAVTSVGLASGQINAIFAAIAANIPIPAA
jgi:Flp pilus assembly pilin Flp